MAVGAGPTASGPMRLRVYVEPAGSFAVDHTGTLGDFVDVCAVEGSIQFAPQQEMHDPGCSVQNVLQYREEVLGRKTATLSFQIVAAPTGVAVTGSAATSNALGSLLKACWGGEYKGGGTTASGAWGSAGGGSVATAANLAEGGAIGWADSSGVVHVREIERISGGVVTLKHRLPGTPASGDTLYGAASYYLTQDPDTSLQFIIQSLEEDDVWVAYGGQGTITPTVNLDGSLNTWQVEIAFADWKHGADAAADLTGPLGTATYPNWEPVSSLDGPQNGAFIARTTGSNVSTGADVDIQALEIQPQVSFTQVTSPNGVNGVLRHRLIRPSGPAVQGSFTTIFENEGYYEARDSKLDKALWHQVGRAAGKITCWSLPTVQYTDVQPAGDGVVSQQVSWKARLDAESNPATADDLSRSPIRYHVA